MKNQAFDAGGPGDTEEAGRLSENLPEGPKILNLPRFGQVLEAAEMLRRAADDPAAVLCLRLDPEWETGTLTAVLDFLAVEDAAPFAGMMGLADCTEFYPRTDGRLEISLTFFRLFAAV